MKFMKQKIVVMPEEKICDYIDGKFHNDTAEEYVRQTIEKRSCERTQIFAVTDKD